MRTVNQVSEFLLTSNLDYFTPTFLILTPIFSQVTIEKYGKTPNFFGRQHFYSYFQNPSENSECKGVLSYCTKEIRLYQAAICREIMQKQINNNNNIFFLLLGSSKYIAKSENHYQTARTKQHIGRNIMATGTCKHQRQQTQRQVS